MREKDLRPPAGTRVLIVEDEAIIAMTVEDMVEELGCVVAGIASSLGEAMSRAEGSAFDVVLLDLNLNGAESTPLAELLAAKGTPFVFTTGYGSGPRRDFPGRPVVSKPYRIDEIGAAISEALRT
jgi:CheY-like chemotaxis protein